jgi:hypothetical protein
MFGLVGMAVMVHVRILSYAGALRDEVHGEGTLSG